jgi:signal peptide peptidase SppA
MKRIWAAFCQPWAILPERLAEIQDYLNRRVALATDAFPEDYEPPQLAAGLRDGSYQTIGKTALIPMLGTLLDRAGAMEAASGAVSMQSIRASLARARDDRSIRSIVLQIDSPGGTVAGTVELASDVAALKGQKKVIAVADKMAASAAYWIGSQAQEFHVSPSGQVGSIGVIAAHIDQSKMEELVGLKTSLVASSKFKAEFDPSIPLSDDARAELQAKVNQYHGQFVKAVAKGRGVSEARVESDFGQGRMVLAKDAVNAGMADGVSTLDQVLRRLGADDGGRMGREAAARVAELGL